MMLTPFLAHHGFTKADLCHLLGTSAPTREQVWALEMLVAKDLLAAAGYTVVLRREGGG
jgi:hypothetical protein